MGDSDRYALVFISGVGVGICLGILISQILMGV